MKVYRIILSFIMMFYCGVMAIMGSIMTDRNFSEAENRVLKDKPIFSWSDLKEGKFTEDYEEYITDQFPNRDFWVSIKASTEKLLQKRDNNGVYLGKDGYLLQKIDKIDEEIVNRNIDAINIFANNNPGIKTNFLLSPTSVGVLKDKLPPFANPKDQLNILRNIQEQLSPKVVFSDVYQELVEHKDEYIYYKTDHHWTSLGAYYAYNYLSSTMGYTPLVKEAFNIKTITDKFYGTQYSFGNYRGIAPDSMDIFEPKEKHSYKVEYLDTGSTSESLYEPKYLDTKDKYSVFLDGNHALSVIKTDNNKDKKLLVIKDSYAHSLVPFLTNNYGEIHMMDLRYFNMSIGNYIKQAGIEEVLLVYNVVSFIEEDSIVKMKFK